MFVMYKFELRLENYVVERVFEVKIEVSVFEVIVGLVSIEDGLMGLGGVVYGVVFDLFV